VGRTHVKARQRARGARTAGTLIVGLVALALLAAACGSGTSSSPATPTTLAGPKQSTTLGVGVTATSIKVGISLIDYSCISAFTNSIRVGEKGVYQAYVNYINEHGGVAGRKIVPVYVKYCPIGTATILAACTSLTEDSNVFADIGTFYDPSGDAQECIAGQHHRVLLTYDLTQAIMNKAPAGLMVTPAVTPERRVRVLLELLGQRKTLAGRTVAVLGDTTVASTVNGAIVPGLKKLGVKMGDTALLTISGSDTTAAQAQLESFIEKWKTEHVDTVFLSGEAVESQQFVTKLRAELPDLLLLSDNNDGSTFGQQLEKAGVKRNPYQGLIAASGQTDQEYAVSPNWTYCKDIYKSETGKVAPGPTSVIPYKDGKTLDTYGAIGNACQLLSMFHDIAQRVGKYLNDANWVDTVNTFGHIANRNAGPYSSLTKGKYDANDNFRLEQFESSIPPEGNFSPITPLQDITG
jgi:Periplasmic binding protein